MLSFQSTFEDLTRSWQLRLQEAEAAESDLPARVETCIRICEESLSQLRQWVMERSFPDKDCEIYFFKQVKPVIMARYIYYQKIYRLHIGYFNGSGLLEKERLEQELKDIARYFADNKDFYTYYRMGYNHHDELFFVRGVYDWKICPEVNQFDGIFTTSGDGKLAELMAYELLLKYIDDRLNPGCKLIEPAPGSAVQRAHQTPLNCTASRTDVVELGYALYAAGFFNYGNASIKDIMAFLSKVLQIDLEHHQRIYYQIRERKRNLTKYLDELKNGFVRYVDRGD
ncbi:RteC domain-containing protein [Longitalea arenae]|uniref:RteC domain-containing protein n=1 Tax=Longitalea arenae TaxID=2812558 RepID=UPI0019680EFC|nr:RteC domain-containing protein [Longitalea arenae]